MVSAGDRALFERVASRAWPGADPVLPRLSRSANRGGLWLGIAAGMWVFGEVRARRAAGRGVVSLALASATVNTLGKGWARRQRPLLDSVPAIRRLSRQPVTSSFPSGHAASAAAFVVGAALEAPRVGAVLAPVAAGVAFSRVYTGVHYPSDVLVGAALGASAAFAVRGVAPSRAQLPPPGRPRVDAPALPEGEGLVVVVNPSSGVQPQWGDPVRQLRAALPRAEVVLSEEGAGSLRGLLEYAAGEAGRRGGALGVCGGDGTVNAAAQVALRHGVPLAVLPGGTFNHFAADLGAEAVQETCAAVVRGSAIRADVGRVRALGTEERRGVGASTGLRGADVDPCAPGAVAGEASVSAGVDRRGWREGEGASGEERVFLNTFSLGVYPELIRVRERWSPRVGGPAATLLGAVRVLRTASPVEAEVNGRRRSMWLLFVGNGAYRSVGIAPVRRFDLADGELDVRVVHGGRLARLRLLAAAVAGGLGRTPVYTTARLRGLRVSGLPEDCHMAFDGEVAPVRGPLLVDTLPEALTVYRPPSD